MKAKDIEVGKTYVTSSGLYDKALVRVIAKGAYIDGYRVSLPDDLPSYGSKNAVVVERLGKGNDRGIRSGKDAAGEQVFAVLNRFVMEPKTEEEWDADEVAKRERERVRREREQGRRVRLSEVEEKLLALFNVKCSTSTYPSERVTLSLEEAEKVVALLRLDALKDELAGGS